tara:strand:+ start:151 stop:504 length:354 start_codon:yes stop_codon:yes gene_type:complete
MSKDISQSTTDSAFMNIMEGRGSYDKEVYENTAGNWVKIVGMLIIFYIWNAMHWWANFALGICNSPASTVYNLCAFGSAVLVISCMLFFGSQVNDLKMQHEFYTEKISEEKQRQSEA